jgi:hypothetical protein
MLEFGFVVLEFGFVVLEFGYEVSDPVIADAEFEYVVSW